MTGALLTWQPNILHLRFKIHSLLKLQHFTCFPIIASNVLRKQVILCVALDWKKQKQNVLFCFVIRFREELLQVSLKIKERNKSRSKFLHYEVLDPEFIPNSIAIWTFLI